MNIKQKLILPILFIFGCLAINTGFATLASADCGAIKTSIINCPDNANKTGNIENSGVWYILLLVLNIMTAGVGILGVGGIVYGAIMYASASDDAGQVTKAKEIIKNVVIGLVAFMAMYALLNFIIPGGIFT